MKLRFKQLLLLLLLPCALFAQSIPNGGSITTGQVWTAAQWAAAWQAKVDTAALGVTIPTYQITTAETTAGITPCNLTFAVANVLRYCADPSGATDNYAKFVQAVASLGSTGGVVVIPPGNYLYSSTTFINVPNNVSIQGAGRYASTITTASPAANIFNLSGYGSSVSQLGFASTTTQTGGVFIKMSGIANTVSDFNSTGDWTAIEMTGVGAVVRNGSLELGASGGARIVVNTGDATPSIENVLAYAQSSPFPAYGIDVVNTDALTIRNVSMITQGVGLGITPNTGQAVNSVFVSDSFFDTNTHGASIVTAGTGVVSRLSFVNTWFGDSTSDGVFVDGAGGVIEGVDLTNCQSSNNSGGAGISLNGTVQHVTVIGGVYGQNVYGVYDNATGDISVIGAKIGAYEGFTNNTSYGIDLATTNITSAVITGNSLNGNTSGAVLNNASAGVAQFATNVGYVSDPLNALSYGADPTGTADSTSAIQHTISVADAAASGGKVHLPAGVYKVSSTLLIGDHAGVYVYGDGPGVTVIQPTSAIGSGNVLQFGQSTGAANQGFSDLSINCVNDPSCIAVDVFGASYFVADNFNITLAYIGILTYEGTTQFYSRFNINRSGSIGISITGSGNGGNDMYFDTGVMSNVGYVQPVAGINIQASGGIWLSNLDIISQGTGIAIGPGSGQAVSFLFGNNVAIDTSAGSGLAVIPSGTGAVNGVDFTASWASSSDSAGVFLGGAGTINGLRLNGMRVFNNKGHGISFGNTGTILNTSISNSDITGNGAPVPTWSSTVQYSTGNLVSLSGVYYTATQASLNHTPPNATYWSTFSYSVPHGVFVSPGVGSFSLVGNRIGSEAGLGVTQGYGVLVSSGSSNNYTITNNDLRGNITGTMTDGGTGSAKIVNSNLGYNPIGSSAITPTTGSFSWTNNTGSPVVVAVSGGTVSSITVETQSTGVTQGQFAVPQGAAIVVTNSSVPAMAYFGLN